VEAECLSVDRIVVGAIDVVLAMIAWMQTSITLSPMEVAIRPILVDHVWLTALRSLLSLEYWIEVELLAMHRVGLRCSTMHDADAWSLKWRRPAVLEVRQADGACPLLDL